MVRVRYSGFPGNQIMWYNKRNCQNNKLRCFKLKYHLAILISRMLSVGLRSIILFCVSKEHFRSLIPFFIYVVASIPVNTPGVLWKWPQWWSWFLAPTNKVMESCHHYGCAGTHSLLGQLLCPPQPALLPVHATSRSQLASPHSQWMWVWWGVVAPPKTALLSKMFHLTCWCWYRETLRQNHNYSKQISKRKKRTNIILLVQQGNSIKIFQPGATLYNCRTLF